MSGENNTITISTPGRYLVHFDGIAGSNTVDTAFSL
nr:MAG TPA: BclA protein [Caudoviricetes sp.]DAR22322.1 MAG TPA: BclA protein [Caudoviricetes sp.]